MTDSPQWACAVTVDGEQRFIPIPDALTAAYLFISGNEMFLFDTLFAEEAR